VQSAATRRSRSTGSSRARLRLPDIGAGVHIVALYSRLAEREALLYPYLRDGLARDHSCTTCLTRGACQPVLDRLSLDLDVNASRSSGQLAVCQAPDGPFPRDRSGVTAASTLWKQVVAKRPRHGYGCQRFSVEAKAWLPDYGETNELLRFEARLTSLAIDQPIAFMFMYDVSGLDGGLVIELARTHPTVWVCGVSLANPYCEASLEDTPLA
jgi:hypothetical protein